MDGYNRPESKTIRVLIVHEVRVVREALAILLQRWSDLVVTFARPEAVEEREREGPPDLVLLAAAENDTSERVREIVQEFSSAKVVVMGLPGSVQEIVSCIEEGASAYTCLDDPPDQIVETIRRVSTGMAVCPPDVLSSVFERMAALKRQLHDAPDRRLTELTSREQGILEMVCQGSSNKEIAMMLNLELQTVKNNVHRILGKLKVRNRREAALVASGLLDAPPINGALPRDLVEGRAAPGMFG